MGQTRSSKDPPAEGSLKPELYELDANEMKRDVFALLRWLGVACLKVLGWAACRGLAFARYRVEAPIYERSLERNLRRKIRRNVRKLSYPMYN